MGHFLQDTFSGYGYVRMLAGQVPTSAETSFCEEWHAKYFQEGFFKIDPVFAFNEVCRYRPAAKLLSVKEMSSSLFEEAHLFGADSNFISISILGGNRMVFGGVNHDLTEEALPKIQRSLQILHRDLLLEGVDALSDAQIDLMEMSEMGLKDKEMAFELEVSLSAIAQRKKVICSKLGTSNFAAALNLYSNRKWSGIVPLSECVAGGLS